MIPLNFWIVGKRWSLRRTLTEWGRGIDSYHTTKIRDGLFSEPFPPI